MAHEHPRTSMLNHALAHRFCGWRALTRNVTLPSALRWCAALSMVAGPALVSAQVDTQLPSLTPRVFESRGAVRVNLPSIARQPLVGFGPPPRQYVVPSERTAITKPFAPDINALAPLNLAPPPEPPSSLPVAHRFRAEGGLGSYLARYGRVDLSATGYAGEFYVDADYDGLSGSDTDDYVHYDRLDLRGGGQSFGTGRLSLDGDLLLDSYRLTGYSGAPTRRRTAFGGRVGFEGVGSTPWEIGAGFTQTRLNSIDSQGESLDSRVEGAAKIGLLQNMLRFDALGGISGQEGGFGSDVKFGQAGGAVAFSNASGASLTLGVRAMAYDAVGAANGGGDGTAFGPIVDVQLPLGPALRGFATNDPMLHSRTLRSLTDINPFVSAKPLVAPDLVPVDAKVGAEIRRGPTRARAYGFGMIAPTYLVFSRLGSLYGESYVSARAFGVGGDLAMNKQNGISASAGLELRYGSASDSDNLPFYSPLIARAGLQVPLLNNRARIGVNGHVESSRPSDRFGNAKAPAFGLVGLDARYDLTTSFALALRGERLVGTVQRWPGFDEAPFTVQLGLRFVR